MHQAHVQLSCEHRRGEDDSEDGFDERSAASVTEAVFTVEDARDMLAVKPLCSELAQVAQCIVSVRHAFCFWIYTQ